MGTPEKNISFRYLVETRITAIETTEIRDSYEKTLKGINDREIEIELLKSNGVDLAVVIKRLIKNLELVLEDHD